MVVIAVEGPDCSGKSTFVERLQRALEERSYEHSVLKFGPPDPLDCDPYAEYEQQLDQHVGLNRVLVCDRLHWGEHVYGPLLRDHDRLGLAGWRHVELSLAARGTLVVYVNTEDGTLFRCLQDRGDDLVTANLLPGIQGGYEWCLRHTALPVLAPSQLDDCAVSMVLEIAEYLLELGPFTRESAPGQSYVGTLFPEVLLFGEKRGGEAPHHGDRLAFVPRDSGSGRWLLEALPDELWRHVGLANACDQDDPGELWFELDKPPVVALGKEAHVALRKARVSHATVPHPQYVRRFHHEKLSEYGKLIQEVAGTAQDRSDWKGQDAQASVRV